MKKIIFIFLLLSNIVVGQSFPLIGESPKDTHILTIGKSEPILVDMLIKSPIEVDGHISKEKFYFKATLSGIEIYDTNKVKYTRRLCSIKECKIIHLQELSYQTTNRVLFTPNNTYYAN